MGALLFANDLFSFREGANRIYVNEYPWYMSDYTGGSTLYTDGSFSYHKRVRNILAIATKRTISVVRFVCIY